MNGLLLLAPVCLLAVASVASPAGLASFATSVPAAFPAAGTNRGGGALTFGVNLLGVNGSFTGRDFLKLPNGSGGAVDAKDDGTGPVQPLAEPFIGGSSGNFGGWGVYQHVLGSPHYRLVPDARIARFGILWPRMVQWRKL